MTQEKKYDFNVAKHGSTWTAEITRRASSKKTVVSKSKTGFKLKREATAWGEAELELFIAKQGTSNTKHQEQRTARNKISEQRETKLAAAKKIKVEQQAIKKAEHIAARKEREAKKIDGAFGNKMVKEEDSEYGDFDDYSDFGHKG